MQASASSAEGSRPSRSGWAFLGALLLLAYVVGDATDGTRRFWPAAEVVRHALESTALLDGHFVAVKASDASAQRIQLLAPTLAGPVLVAGGRHRFPDRCPGFVGCVAVEYDRHGRFVHGYPFRPEAYEAARVHHGLAQSVGYEQAVGFDFAKHAGVSSVASYSNGDLAVVLHSRFSVPAGLGIARIGRDGRPRWFRADGSHHWATVTYGRLRGVGAGLPDAVVVPARRMAAGTPQGRHGRLWERQLGWAPCRTHFVDYLHVIDGEGVLLRRVAIDEALRTSRHAPVLVYTTNDCDPLRPNSVAVSGGDGPPGLAAGDFLLSLRGLGALAALDGRDGHLKRIWRGTFYGQHSARELPGPQGPAFLLFDPSGGVGAYGPGRLLALDARSGRERTVYASASPTAPSPTRGGVSIAPDGSRAIVHAHASGNGAEVDLASGETTAVFSALDDVSALLGMDEPSQAFRWRTSDIRYVAAAPAAVRAPR